MDVLDLPCLVLDSAHKPTHFTNAKEAICNVLSDKAISLIDYEEVVHSQKFSMKIPKVIIGYYGTVKSKARYTKLNILYRDDQKCSYCGKRYAINKLNIDHIVPKSKFNEFLKNSHLHEKFKTVVGIDEIPKTKNGWLNTVCTCLKCNEKKGNKYLWNTNYKLLNKPYIPEYTPRIVMTIQYAEKTGFLPYLEKHNGTFVRLIDYELRKNI